MAQNYPDPQLGIRLGRQFLTFSDETVSLKKFNFQALTNALKKWSTTSGLDEHLTLEIKEKMGKLTKLFNSLPTFGKDLGSISLLGKHEVQYNLKRTLVKRDTETENDSEYTILPEEEFAVTDDKIVTVKDLKESVCVGIRYTGPCVLKVIPLVKDPKFENVGTAFLKTVIKFLTVTQRTESFVTQFTDLMYSDEEKGNISSKEILVQDLKSKLEDATVLDTIYLKRFLNKQKNRAQPQLLLY